MAHSAEMAHDASLATLDLSQNYMEDCDLQSVLTSELPKLRHLMLSFNKAIRN
jgi:Leucine-rich repeat (LRR) protein